MRRYATAVWEGAGRNGRGHVTTQSAALAHARYSFASRFAAEAGTNPEELLAAAHAMCFTLKLSFVLEEAGFVPELLETTATVSFEMGAVTASHLELTATVAGISAADFAACVKEAKRYCPISAVLRAAVSTSVRLTDRLLPLT